MNKNKIKGFTLLELLIVIAILAILATITILVLNPAETMKKSRDVQRISDLASLKSALGLYVTENPVPVMGTSTTFYVSYASDSGVITDPTLPTGDNSFTAWGQVPTANLYKTDGTGWVPIDLSGGVSGGSPLSALPVDPSNTIADLAAVANTDLIHRYAISTANNTSFELGTTLESDYYTTTDIRAEKDGGDNATIYEVGTTLTIFTSH